MCDGCGNYSVGGSSEADSVLTGVEICFRKEMTGKINKIFKNIVIIVVVVF